MIQTIFDQLRDGIKKRSRLIGLAIVTILFLLQTIQPPQDIDLGWHLKYGEYFFQHWEVLKDNRMSFVWPDYQWVQASWGYDLLLYQIYTHFGFLGIAIAGSLITGAIFLIITYPLGKRSVYEIFLLAVVFLAMASPLYGASMRSQTPSTLFFAIIMVLNYQILFRNRARLAWCLPIVFLGWANMHGGFSLGIILSLLMLFMQTIMSWFKKIWHLSFIAATGKTLMIYAAGLGLSLITPLLNPWGTRIYEETFKHSTNTNLTVITEWMPLYQMVPLESILTGFVVLIVLGLAFKRKRIEDIPLIIVLLILMAMAYSAMRFLITFGTFITFYLAMILPSIKLDFWNKFSIKRVLQAGLIVLLILDFFFFKRYFVLSDWRILNMDWNGWCQITLSGSEPIAKIMNDDPPVGNGFHPYNFGGYLIWRVPKVKTFIDGRMAAWEDDQGRTPPIIEGDEVIYKNGPLIFQKFNRVYNFNWAIVITETPIDRYLANLSDWERKYRDYYFSYYVNKHPK